MSSNHHPKNIILGAGPTGLSTGLGVALRNSNRKSLIVEAKDKPGGLAGSFNWKNHIIDYGPHRLSINLENVRILAEDLLGPDCLVKKNLHGVHFGDKLYQFPPRVIDWLSPVSLFQLFAFGFSFIWGHLSWVTRRFTPDNFESIMNRKFGKHFSKTIIFPMTKKVWADTNEIDPSFVAQRFASIQPFEVMKKLIIPSQELNPSSFYYPRHGFQQLWTNIAERFIQEENKISYNSRAVKMEVDQNRIVSVHLETENGIEIIEGNDLEVVSTIPITALINSLSGFSEIDSLKEMIRGLRFRSMLLIILEFSQPETLPFRTLIFPEGDICFNRLFEQNQYSRDTVKDGHSVVVADITAFRNDPFLEKSDEEIIELVKKDLHKLSYVNTDRITDAHVKRVEFAYVVPDALTRNNFHNILHLLKNIRNLTLAGRFSVGEYDNSDYALDHGLVIGAYLCGEISKLDYLMTIYQNRGRPIVG